MCSRPAAAGATCLRLMARRRRSTTGTTAGRGTVSGSGCSRRSPHRERCPMSCRSTAAMWRRIARQRAQKGGVGRSDRPLARWQDLQDPLPGRRSRQTGRLHADAGQHCRYQCRDTAAQPRNASQAPARRQGLWCRQSAQLAQATTHQGRHPLHRLATQTLPSRQAHLSPQERHRAPILSPQELATHRYQIRPACHKLPRCHRSRSPYHRVA